MNLLTGIAQRPALKVLLSALVLLASPAVLAQGIHITLRGNVNPNPGTDHYSDVVAEGNFAYVSSWHNTSGVWIFDVSNPDAPKFVTKYAPSGTSLNMQGIEVLNGIGYFGDDSGGGIHIVDLSNPAKPKLITRICSAAAGCVQGGYDNVHDLTLDGNAHMFVPNYHVNKDVQVWNVSNPAAPFLQMTLTGTDTVSVHDVTVKNNRLFMSGWGGEVDIWDITFLDTLGPTLLGSFFSGLHTQDVSLSDDGNFLFCPRELSSNGDVRIFNVSDPTHVVEVADITQPGWGIAATSPSTSKIMGNLLFVAWYQAGLLVFDVSDPTQPVMVGNYETWPGPKYGGVGGGDGDWGVWPFLGLDRVLVSDRTSGLYVLDATGVSSQPAVFALSFNPTSLLGSQSTTGTAFLLGLAPSSPNGMTVNLSSNNPAVSPSPVFIPAGGHSATFSQSTSAVGSTATVTVTASDGTYNAWANLTLLAPQPASLTVSPSSLRGGGTTGGGVTFNAPVVTDTTVSLTVLSGGAAVASMPASVVVQAGFSSAIWAIATNVVSASTQVKISATANGATKNAFFTVLPPVPSSLTFNPSSVTGGNSSTATVGFPVPVIRDTVVTLAIVSGASGVASIPSTVTVTQGNSSANFTVVTKQVSAKTTVTVSATANGGTKTNTFTVN